MITKDCGVSQVQYQQNDNKKVQYLIILINSQCLNLMILCSNLYKHYMNGPN